MRGNKHHRKTEGIGAVGTHDLYRIRRVAQGLTQLPSFDISDQAGQIHIIEGTVSHELIPHHHHTGDPEEQDVMPGYQGGRGIKTGQLRCLFRPSHGGKRP